MLIKNKNQTEANNRPLQPSWAQLLSYGQLALPVAFAGIPIYILAPEYYAVEFGVSLGLLGLVLLLLRFIDAAQDPIIGYVSDKYHQQRHLILGLGILLLGIGFWFLFHPLESAVLWSFGLSVFICSSGFSIVTINYQAWGGLWPVNDATKTTISATREAFGLIGLIIAAIAPQLLGQEKSATQAFDRLTWSYLPLLIVSAYLFFYWFKKAQVASWGTKNVSNRANIHKKINWKQLNNSWNRNFFGIFFLNNLANSIAAVLVIFFINDWLQTPDWSGFFLLLYFLCGALSMFVWQKAAKTLGTTTSWLLSMIIAVSTFAGTFFINPGHIVAYSVVCFSSGFALGADLALPPAIIAQRITKLKHQHLASSYYSTNAFLVKGSLGIASGLALPILAWLGYQPQTGGAASNAHYLAALYALGPCLIKVLTIIWLYLWLYVFNTRQKGAY